jgi:hypothetical protein
MREMETTTIDDAVLRFEQKFLKLLIPTEIVAGGTAPAKLLPDPEQNNNQPLIFDFYTLPEHTLPDIWRDPDIVAARTLALTPEGERIGDFQERYAAARRVVWNKFQHLYEDALTEVRKIQDPIMQMTRIEDLNALQMNYEYAGFNLGLRPERTTYAEAQNLMIGDRRIPTRESLDHKVRELSSHLTRIGFSQETLPEQMIALRKVFNPIKEEDVVATYERYFRTFMAKIEKMLDLPEGYFKLRVRALAQGRGNLGSFEYEGDGQVLTSIEVNDKHTEPELIYVTAHEATHLLEAVLIERYLKSTNNKDKYAAVSTMCTPSVALNEGISDFGVDIFEEEVRALLGKQSEFVRVLAEHQNVRKEALHYTTYLAHTRLADPDVDAHSVAKELESILLQSGFNEKEAAARSNALVSDRNAHKRLGYWGFYAPAKRMVGDMFAQYGGFQEGLGRFAQLTEKYGPLTLQSLRYAMATHPVAD